ncbi:MAG: hypothetical protein JO165_11840 [Candidatus Eremiobacteraeota bacterium]|nr:hypothetical protein [Candidatus Eremiobacteraeota bacterium]
MLALNVFRSEVDAVIANHPIVRENRYTAWFSSGAATLGELRHFTVQFSVFSHLFIEAQLRKCINARDVQSYRAGKEILMNELGVTFTREGSVENGRFTFRAGHFEWLADFAAHLGLGFHQIGKRSLGTRSTLDFCAALMEWYGSDDPSTAAGASHAIEHWAAAGFWKELIIGLRAVRAQRIPELPLGFWTWHDKLEDQHAAHTDDELDAVFAHPEFEAKRFLTAARTMLDAVQGFWDGLQADRFALKAAS